MDKSSFFILNVFLNSFLAFFTAALLVEGVIFFFRIKPGRAAALLRMIPILKLPLDLFLYDFSRWSYVQGINPLNCEEGTRTLSALFGWANFPSDWLFFSAIECTVLDHMTFTLADVIGYMATPSYLKIFSASLIFLCACFLMRKLVMYHNCIKSLNSMTIYSKQATRKIHNSHFLARMKKGKYSIYASSTLQNSPFIAGLFSPTIYIPSHLLACLTRKEYEAVLAHEMEHIRHRDVFIRFILDIIASIFWWIPTKWLQNKIKEGQEISCDYQCSNYGVHSVDLASAICKSAKYAQGNPTPIFASHLTEQKTLKRIKILAQPIPRKFQKVHLICACFAVSLAVPLILFGRFWIF